MVAVTTFKCEGCGQRFPASRLYGRVNSRGGSYGAHLRAMARGRFASTNKPYYIYTTVCSAACCRRAVRRTYQEWFQHFYALFAAE